MSEKRSGCAGPGRIFQSLKESLLIHYSLKNVHCALFPQYTINITAKRRSIFDRVSVPAKEEKVYAGAHKGSLHRSCRNTSIPSQSLNPLFAFFQVHQPRVTFATSMLGNKWSDDGLISNLCQCILDAVNSPWRWIQLWPVDLLLPS